jgi:DNA-binding GntR family transcriptional regulator
VTDLAGPYDHDSISVDLRREILAGHYRPGYRLPSLSTLSATYGVGRQRVRTVLANMSAAGILRHEPKHGWFVATGADLLD